MDISILIVRGFIKIISKWGRDSYFRVGKCLFQSGAKLFQSGAVTSKWGKILFQSGAFISKWDITNKVRLLIQYSN